MEPGFQRSVMAEYEQVGELEGIKRKFGAFVRTRGFAHFGFHLFKVTDRKEATPIPRGEIPGFEESYLSELRATGIADLIDRLKSASSIEEVAETAV